MHGLSTVPLDKDAWSQLQVQWCRAGVSWSCLSPCACGTRTFSLCLCGQNGVPYLCGQNGVPSVQSLSVWPERGAISVWPERSAIRLVSVCMARTGCHPFNLYLWGQNGVSPVQSLSVWPEPGAILSVCLARTGCHPFSLYQFVAY